MTEEGQNNAKSPVDWNHPDQQKLFESLRKRGHTDADIKRIIGEHDDPKEALDRLMRLSKPLVDLPPGAKPHTPNPPRELDPHEEALLGEILAGEIQPQYE